MKNINTKTKAWINLFAFFLTIAINAIGSMGVINGMSQKNVSDKYHTLITPSSISFSIWGVIYSLVLISLIFMIVKEKKLEVKKLINIFSPIFLLTSLFNIIWIVLFSLEKMALSTVFILGLLISLTILNRKLLEHNKEIPFRITSIAFGLYVGWLTIATVVNISAFLVSINWDGFGISPTIWAPLTIVLSIIIVIYINGILKNAIYTLPIAWAFYGNILEMDRLKESLDYGLYIKPVLIIGIIILLIVSVLQFINNNYCVLEREKKND